MFVVTVQPDGIRLPVRPGETIDAALVRAGFARTTRGCRRGGCGACLAVLHLGTTTHERPIAGTVLTMEQRAGGHILLCRSVPSTDVEVSLVQGGVRCVSPIQRRLAERELPERQTHQEIQPTGGT